MVQAPKHLHVSLADAFVSPAFVSPRQPFMESVVLDPARNLVKFIFSDPRSRARYRKEVLMRAQDLYEEGELDGAVAHGLARKLVRHLAKIYCRKSTPPIGAWESVFTPAVRERACRMLLEKTRSQIDIGVFRF